MKNFKKNEGLGKKQKFWKWFWLDHLEYCIECAEIDVASCKEDVLKGVSIESCKEYIEFKEKEDFLACLYGLIQGINDWRDFDLIDEDIMKSIHSEDYLISEPDWGTWYET